MNGIQSRFLSPPAQDGPGDRPSAQNRGGGMKDSGRDAFSALVAAPARPHQPKEAVAPGAGGRFSGVLSGTTPGLNGAQTASDIADPPPPEEEEIPLTDDLVQETPDEPEPETPVDDVLPLLSLTARFRHGHPAPRTGNRTEALVPNSIRHGWVDMRFGLGVTPGGPAPVGNGDVPPAKQIDPPPYAIPLAPAEQADMTARAGVVELPVNAQARTVRDAGDRQPRIASGTDAMVADGPAGDGADMRDGLGIAPGQPVPTGDGDVSDDQPGDKSPFGDPVPPAKQAASQAQPVNAAFSGQVQSSPLDTRSLASTIADIVDGADQAGDRQSRLPDDARVTQSTPQTMRIQLKPEHLGHVGLTLRTTGEGLIVEMRAETAEGQRLLEMDADSVTDWLRHQGCTIAELRVTGAHNAQGAPAATMHQNGADRASSQGFDPGGQAQAGDGGDGHSGGASGGGQNARDSLPGGRAGTGGDAADGAVGAGAIYV